MHGASIPQALPESERDCLAAVSPCQWITPSGCESAVWRNRATDPLAAILAARESWCGRPRAAEEGGSIHTSSPWPSCSPSCVVVIKIHGSFYNARKIFARLLLHEGTRVVIVERRDTRAKYCSLQYSRAFKNWHNSASQSARKFKKAWQAKNCPTVAPPKFVKHHDEWYEWGRRTLREAGRPWLELTTEEYAKDPISAEAELHAFAGLPAQKYRGACNGNGCNCEYESV